MHKNLIIYIAASLLLILVLLLYYSANKTLNTHSALVNRHQLVYNSFQRLGKLINNAAVIHPDMLRSSSTNQFFHIFVTDSSEISLELLNLQQTARDTSIKQILAILQPLIHSEIGWILNSNVPDSIMQHRTGPHFASLLRIDSLINHGTVQTRNLISYQHGLVEREIKKVRTLIVLFIILSGLLLIYTTAVSLTQQSKRKSKEKELAIVLNRISDGVMSIDTKWRYTFLNDAAMTNHPGDRAAVIGQKIWDVHPALESSPFGQKYYEARQTGSVQEVEEYYAPLQSWFSARIYPSSDGLTIYYKDVTEQRRAADQLSQTLKEVRDYRFALDEASIVAITDQKGIILHANENFCKISKYPLQELIGQDHRIINSGYHSKEFIRNLWVTIAKGKIWKGEVRNKAKDGSVYWVDTTIVPFLNDQGKPYQYIAIRADITQRKETEEQLQRSERTYKTIASSIPDSVICMLDRDFRYLLIEGDMLGKLGYAKEDLMGKLASNALSPVVFAELEPEFQTVLSGAIVTKEANRNGYDIVSRYIPLKDTDNQVYAIMTVSIDVTKLKHAQRNINELNKSLERKIALRTEELRKSNEELESFSYSVSHDLRAPLRGIIGFAAVLKEEYGGKLDAEADRILGIVQNNADKMGQLIDDLLAFSRTGKQALQKVDLDTMEMVSEVIQEVIKPDAPHSINWEVGVLPRVNADPNSFKQVWSNLLSNAVKYSGTKADPHIEIGAIAHEDRWEFFVRDNGVGFDEKYKHKLFKVFQRLHDANEFEGTGVGLALVERIIAKHGGSIHAEGEPGKGACFTFSLPI